MTYFLEIDNINYTINVEKDSGRVEIFKYDCLYLVGQWLPSQQCLCLPKCKDEVVRLKLQDELKIRLSLENITLPSYIV